MPNWKRTPPVSGLSIEEIKRRAEAGINRWREKGRLRPITKSIKTHREGAGLDKPSRKRIIQASNMAIYALANGDALDYCAAIDVINSTRRLNHLSLDFMTAICEGIADAAAYAAGEPLAVMDALARTWLAEHHRPSSKVISIPKTKGT